MTLATLVLFAVTLAVSLYLLGPVSRRHVMAHRLEIAMRHLPRALTEFADRMAQAMVKLGVAFVEAAAGISDSFSALAGQNPDQMPYDAAPDRCWADTAEGMACDRAAVGDVGLCSLHFAVYTEGDA